VPCRAVRPAYSTQITHTMAVLYSLVKAKVD
jgi:hypothetical protein